MKITRRQLRRIIKEELSRALLREAVSLEDALKANRKDRMSPPFTLDDLRDSNSRVREEDHKDIVIVDLEEDDNSRSHADLARRGGEAEFKVGDETLTLSNDDRMEGVEGMQPRYAFFLRNQ